MMVDMMMVARGEASKRKSTSSRMLCRMYAGPQWSSWKQSLEPALMSIRFGCTCGTTSLRRSRVGFMGCAPKAWTSLSLKSPYRFWEHARLDWDD